VAVEIPARHGRHHHPQQVNEKHAAQSRGIQVVGWRGKIKIYVSESASEAEEYGKSHAEIGLQFPVSEVAPSIYDARFKVVSGNEAARLGQPAAHPKRAQ
jgi:hypothetical protein